MPFIIQSRDEYRALRSIIIDMVLATEMNKHFEHLNKFVNKFSVDMDEKSKVKDTFCFPKSLFLFFILFYSIFIFHLESRCF
jgi:hypothetical protein